MALLATEGVQLSFEKGGIKQIADMAFDINEKDENIGARRLHIMEFLFRDLLLMPQTVVAKKFL